MTAVFIWGLLIGVFFIAPTARAAADRCGRRRRELARVPRIDTAPRVPPPRRADPSPAPPGAMSKSNRRLGDYEWRAISEGDAQR